MPSNTPISQCMTTRVTTIPVDAAPSEARRLLTREGINHLPVVDGGRVVGVLSSRDLIRALRAAGAPRSEPIDTILDRGASLAELMTRELVTVHPNEDIDRAIDLIADGHIHSVLVLNEDRRLVGIVTDTDLLDYLCA